MAICPSATGKDNLSGIAIYSPRGQCMTLLMAALAEMGAIQSKQTVISFIQHKGWFNLHPNDLIPYPSQTEPHWHTDIAWGRKEAVLRGYMFDHDELDHWELTRLGLERAAVHRKAAAEGKLDVSRCYLWSVKFKQRMNPAYVPSEADIKRPEDLKV